MSALRDTEYATEVATADIDGQAIERLFIKEKSRMRAIVLAALTLASGPALAADAPCGLYGAVYAPNPQPSLHDPDQPAFYRLAVRHLPDSAPDAAFADAWVFQVFDPTGGHLMTEFSMEEGCPNGAGLCRVGVPGSQDAVSSDVVELTQNFAPAVAAGQAPYAIILPGFAAANWVFTQASPEVRGMRFLTSPPAYPDVSHAVVWVRESCGAD
jgi:hypothetical protein